MKKVATIILNRNLPSVTDSLYEQFQKHDGKNTDIFVVESGSHENHLSKYKTWWANDPDSVENGLRYCRGFNYGLSELWKEGKFKNYDYFYLVCNDVKFNDEPIVTPLVEEMEKHPRMAILSPCSHLWGEKHMIPPMETRYFWEIQFLSFLVRREFIEEIMNTQEPDMMNVFFDGSNFRGYAADLETVIKAYANDWAAGITTKVWQDEDDSILKTKADLMKTDPYDVNLKKLFSEGKDWLRAKYGFNSRWTMQMYAKSFYQMFFEHYPEYGRNDILAIKELALN